MRENILIVEDEPSIVTLIKYNLQQEKFQTDVAYDGLEAVKLVRENQYDLIILDLMLPKMNGMEVCNIVRQEKSHIPILILTAKDEEYDKIYGLEMGADDYVTKPFSPKELIVRMKAILKRTKHQEIHHNRLTIGEIDLYPDRFAVYFKGKTLPLKRKEFALLLYLMQHKNKDISREILLNKVWNYDFVGDTRIVDVNVSNLREKIESDSKNPGYIKTIRGFGYRLEEPNEKKAN